MISLLMNDPLVISHITGSSRDALNPVAFSAFTARSSPSRPAVFFAATLLMTAASSSRTATSSRIAKIPLAMFVVFSLSFYLVLSTVAGSTNSASRHEITAKLRQTSIHYPYLCRTSYEIHPPSDGRLRRYEGARGPSSQVARRAGARLPILPDRVSGALSTWVFPGTW